ncbi:MAG: FAD-binding domain-containing protein [Pseudomonadota bacterium]
MPAAQPERALEAPEPRADGAAPNPDPQRVWPATRAEGLRRLADFAPAMGRIYKTRRNYDLGPDNRANVSLLSPYTRRRLITEREAVSVALSAHSASSAEKFVQEVFWRTYWKGWLELRPSVWRAYRDELSDDRARLADDRALRKRLEKAEAGATGIDPFDAWAAELTETGYLHNHARMWFASIWVFTLGLPWRLGADFFLRHLLDGDPASNTLGWRWVAGLQTRGKNYVAAAWNIEKFTGGRFDPSGQLNERARPLAEDERLSAAGEPPLSGRPDADRPTAVLITEEDCALEIHPDLEGLPLAALAVAPMPARRSDAEVSDAVARFDREALDDAAARFTEARGWSGPVATLEDSPGALAAWARDAGAEQIVTPYAPIGWVRERLDAERPALRDAGLTLIEPIRVWDQTCWPAATAGFFKFKERIPEFIRSLL